MDYINASGDHLFQYHDSINKLFTRSFGKELNFDLWNWAYLENPTGNPIVLLAIENEEVIGHYAMIPIPFRSGESELLGYLSMTTMVDLEFRHLGLFSNLANLAYDLADIDSFVFGFPNSKSFPGFKKRLEWKVDTNYQIATIGRDLLRDSFDELVQNKEGNIQMDISNPDYFEWRCSKPATKYLTKGDAVYKEFNNSIDILIPGTNLEVFLEMDVELYNVYTDNVKVIEKSEHSTPYYFGGKNFKDSQTDLNLKPNLLMSDVF